MPRLYLTGGQGFVGRWFRRLAPALLDRHGVELVGGDGETDVLDEAALATAVANAKPDWVIHLAARSNVPAAFRDPEATLRVNLLGTLHVLRALVAGAPKARLLYVSSGDVYGMVAPHELPIAESHPPRPRSPYAVSKLAAEALCWQWCQTEGLDAVIARPFNHVGAGQAPDFVLPALARQVAAVARGEATAIEAGDLDVTRDFTDVADVIDAYCVLLRHGVRGESYNVCSGEERRVADLLARLFELAGVPGVPVRRDPARMRPAEQRRVRGENGKIRALGWTPTHSIDASLKDLLDEANSPTSQWHDPH